MGVAVALGWGLLLAAWLALHWVILPHIPQWRGSIETRASRALGVPVRIGDIEVRSSGWTPTIELREVSLLGAGGRPALRLPRVVAALSARSLLALEIDFEQLLIEGAELDVQRDAAGRLRVAGLDFDGGAGQGDSGAVDWFFRQREFVIRGGAVRWTDALRQAPPLTLANVDFVVRNGLREHSLRLDATPPDAWGERFSVAGRFTQPLLARRGDWRRWSGTVYGALPRADVRQLKQYLALPFELSEGNGALRAWVDVKHGEAVAATLDLALRDISVRLAPEVDVLRFAEAQGRFIGARDRDGVTLEAQRFGFATGDGVRWPAGGLRFAWRQREGQPPAGGTFSADRLDLGLMAQIATRVPLGAAASKLLDDLRPQGVAGPIEVRWEGRASTPTHYRVSGRLVDLSLAARPAAEPEALGRPGVRRATLQFDATDTGGTASVDLAHGALDLPGIFEDPVLPFDRFAAKLAWKIDPVNVPASGPLTDGGATPGPRITLQVQDARFANADAHAEVTARWTTGDGEGMARGGRFPGRLELDAKVGDAAANRIHRYLPLGLSRGMRDYAQRALQGGKVQSASVRIRGDLWDFPFFNAPRVGDRTRRSEGQFRIAGKVDDVTFAYVPEAPGALPGASPRWPKLTALSGELLLDRNLLDIRGGRARVDGLEIDQIGGKIEHLENDAGLTLEGRAKGPLSDMLRFVDDSPIGGWLGKALASATATGNAELRAGIGVPLSHPDVGSSVRGSLLFAGNDLRLVPASPVLGNTRGRVDFTQQGFTLVGAGARVYGGEATFQGGTDHDGNVRLSGQGSATAEGLQRATELGPLTRLATSFTGQTGYRVGLAFPRGQPEIDVTSNLVGLAIDLPAPLAKTAETALGMRYQTGPEAAETPQESIKFDLDNLVQARFVREAGSASGRVLRGGIGVGAPAPPSTNGVAAMVDARSLDVDAWQAVADRVFPADAPGAATAPGAGAGVGSVGSGGFEPDRIGLRAQTLDAGSRRLTRVTAGLTREGATWRVTVDADQLAGYVEARLPGARNPNAGGRLYARLSRLSLPKSEAEQVSTLLDSRPATIPSLDVVVDDFDLRGMRLGRLEIEATNRLGVPRRDAQRDWQLNRLAVTTPEASLAGSGLWAASGAPGAGRRMAIDFQLQLADGGALLDRLGTRNAIRGGKGKLAGQVAWVGTPFAIDYPSLSGQVNVAIDAGQFLKAEPGAARLLGVLSLQSLPRRLTLDFRDVFAEGFAFDNVTGDMRIAHGVAETRNLRMRGVQATVLMEGSADIERETQNLHVVVVPEINAGTAALAYAAINPAIGLGAFLAQWVLRKPLMAAGTREFEVTGPWADPKVTPLARRPAAETSAASAPQRNP